jgi:hypothetical protein
MARAATFAIVIFTIVSLFETKTFAQDSTSVRKSSVATKTDSVVSTKKKKKKRTKKKKAAAIKPAPKKAVAIAPSSRVKPTMTGTPGTVKYYFFPTDTGTWWKLRTVQLLIDQNNKLVRADTLFSESRVIDNKRFSLQRFPLLITSDTSYKSTGVGARSESSYYVDDSIAMTVFNNSVTHSENRIFLVSPVKIRNAWHEKFEDTTVTAIAGFVDSVTTPIGTFDSVLVTLTQQDYSDMRKYYVPGRGIVKTVFRSPGPSGRGLVIVTTEMVGFKKPGEQ